MPADVAAVHELAPALCTTWLDLARPGAGAAHEPVPVLCTSRYWRCTCATRENGSEDEQGNWELLSSVEGREHASGESGQRSSAEGRRKVLKNVREVFRAQGSRSYGECEARLLTSGRRQETARRVLTEEYVHVGVLKNERENDAKRAASARGKEHAHVRAPRWPVIEVVSMDGSRCT